MTETRDTYLLLRAFADELARCGVRHACTSPGSRSTPLVLTLAREPRLSATSHIDERAGAFFALGIGKSSAMPAILACTSGTAAANYTPAVIEAHEARVPLIILTADRPPELRESGAGQTIDQIKLYGNSVRWFFEVGTHAATPDRMRWIRQLACRAVWTATGDRPGPVHLNFSLREPLILDEELPVDDSGRSDGRPWTARAPVTTHPEPLVWWLKDRPGGVVVAGRDDADPPGTAVAALAEALGWPLLADPLSGARRGHAAIAHYDALLRNERWAAAFAPECVLRVGDLPTSKALRCWLRALDVPQAGLLMPGSWPDPDATLTDVLQLSPRHLAQAADQPFGRDSRWLGIWRSADAVAAAALEATLGNELNEPNVVRTIASALPDDARLVVASSMPVRDVESFWPVQEQPTVVLANRGANGIDGTISTAYGVAAESGAPTYLLIGDVALAHDLSGLLAGKRLGTPLTIVVIDNGGGGIFDFLPVATQRDVFEHHVATPTGLAVAKIAALFDAAYRFAESRADLASALQPIPAGTTIVHVQTDRTANVTLHQRCWNAVAAEFLKN